MPHVGGIDIEDESKIGVLVRHSWRVTILGQQLIQKVDMLCPFSMSCWVSASQSLRPLYACLSEMVKYGNQAFIGEG